MGTDSGILDARPVEAPEIEWAERVMRMVGFFSKLEAAQLAEILPYMLVIRYKAGISICEEGDPGDAMYLIFRGQVVVTKDGWKEPVATLREGAFFGEMALLFGEPRSATVTTLGEAEVFCLAIEDFNRLVDQSPDMNAALRELAESRRQELARS